MSTPEPVGAIAQSQGSQETTASEAQANADTNTTYFVEATDPTSYKTAKGARQAQKHRYCRICDVTLRFERYTRHTRSRRHQEALRKLGLTSIPIPPIISLGVPGPVHTQAVIAGRVLKPVQAQGPKQVPAEMEKKDFSINHRNPTKQTAWTPEQDETLLRMYFELKADAQISEAIVNKSENQVRNRRVQLLKGTSEVYQRVLKEHMSK